MWIDRLPRQTSAIHTLEGGADPSQYGGRVHVFGQWGIYVYGRRQWAVIARLRRISGACVLSAPCSPSLRWKKKKIDLLLLTRLVMEPILNTTFALCDWPCFARGAASLPGKKHESFGFSDWLFFKVKLKTRFRISLPSLSASQLTGLTIAKEQWMNFVWTDCWDWEKRLPRLGEKAAVCMQAFFWVGSFTWDSVTCYLMDTISSELEGDSCVQMLFLWRTPLRYWFGNPLPS